MQRDDKRAERAFTESQLAKDCNHAELRVGQKDIKGTEICLYCVKRFPNVFLNVFPNAIFQNVISQEL